MVEATVIVEFESSFVARGQRIRLVSKSSGYIFERRDKDSLGGDMWTRVGMFSKHSQPADKMPACSPAYMAEMLGIYDLVVKGGNDE